MGKEIAMSNPFTPTFGQIPANMAGRDPILREMAYAFGSTTRAPELTMLISGARGCGKTALLARISEEASSRGWISVSTVAAPGMLEDILTQAYDKASHLVSLPLSQGKVRGVGIGQVFSMEWDAGEKMPSNWRLQTQKLLEALEEADSGLLVLVDELDPSVDEAVALASIYQLFVMEGRRISLVMAGLPYNIERAKSDKRISFVRRAQQRRLGRVSDFEVYDSMRKTIEQGGRGINEEALNVAVRTSGGFPFMIQLVGYRMWANNPESKEITLDDALSGSQAAEREFESYVLESTYRDISDGDLAFLKAMLPDEGPSSIKDIASRMGKSTSYASTYRERLMRQGIIGETDRNSIGFELPGFKNYLIERLS